MSAWFKAHASVEFSVSGLLVQPRMGRACQQTVSAMETTHCLLLTPEQLASSLNTRLHEEECDRRADTGDFCKKEMDTMQHSHNA